MVEGQLGKGDVPGRVPPQPLVEHHGLGNLRDIDLRVEMRHDHDLAQARQLFHQLGNALERIVGFSVVAVAVGTKQQLGLDLAEAVEHAVDAEIRRAR
jgi:hypothetical protein